MNNITFKKTCSEFKTIYCVLHTNLLPTVKKPTTSCRETSLKATDNEEKYTPDTNFKGWIYTIMRNIFINNYRKVVRDRTFVDTTDNLYHLNLPRDTAFLKAQKAHMT